MSGGSSSERSRNERQFGNLMFFLKFTIVHSSEYSGGWMVRKLVLFLHLNSTTLHWPEKKWIIFSWYVIISLIRENLYFKRNHYLFKKTMTWEIAIMLCWSIKRLHQSTLSYYYWDKKWWLWKIIAIEFKTTT